MIETTLGIRPLPLSNEVLDPEISDLLKNSKCPVTVYGFEYEIDERDLKLLTRKELLSLLRAVAQQKISIY